jgi:bacterioferritin-associated ferredoxin
MSVQLGVALVIVAAAVAYLGWTLYRTVAGKRKGCGSGCGECPAATEPVVRGRVSLPQV